MAIHDDARVRQCCAGATVRLLVSLFLLAALVVAAGCAHPPRSLRDRQRRDRDRHHRASTPRARRGAFRVGRRTRSPRQREPALPGVFPWGGVVLDYELFDRYVLERDLVRIQRYYRARGYYEAHVRAGRVERTAEHHVRVTVVVQEGPRVDVGEVRLEGVATLPIDDAAAVLKAVRRRLRQGKPFEEERYETAQENLVRALAARGFVFASVKGSAEVDLNRHVADVTPR
jgi:outer membrane translocation and assembly module TamA